MLNLLYAQYAEKTVQQLFNSNNIHENTNDKDNNIYGVNFYMTSVYNVLNNYITFNMDYTKSINNNFYTNIDGKDNRFVLFINNIDRNYLYSANILKYLLKFNVGNFQELRMENKQDHYFIDSHFDNNFPILDNYNNFPVILKRPKDLMDLLSTDKKLYPKYEYMNPNEEDIYIDSNNLFDTKYTELHNYIFSNDEPSFNRFIDMLTTKYEYIFDRINAVSPFYPYMYIQNPIFYQVDHSYLQLIQSDNIYLVNLMVMALKNGNINIIEKLFEVYIKELEQYPGVRERLSIDLNASFLNWLLPIPFYDNINNRRDKNKDGDILQILIDNKFDISGSYNNFPHIYSVIRSNNHILLQKFISLGARIDPEYIRTEYNSGRYILNNSNNESPLYHAVLNNNKDAIELLIQLGISVNLSDDNLLPLSKAVEMNNIDLVNLLIKYGADRSIPLITAIKMNNIDLIELLIGWGADVNNVYKYSTPLFTAIEMKDINLIKLLIERGAKVNIMPNEFSRITPLFMAIKMNDINLIELLIEKGADVNANSESNDTPLIRAIKMKDINLVTLLIKNGADVNKKTDYGDTPLTIAKKIDDIDTEIIQLLILAGAT
jgi:ankyrin repeat protein